MDRGSVAGLSLDRAGGCDVTGGGVARGRRNNGLFAPEYAAVGDVDPRIGEHLLDVLGNRGIAAYLQPSSDQHPVTRLTTLPGRPVDRLYVDRRELTAAKEFFAIATADADIVGPPVDPADGTRPGGATPAARTSTEFEAAWASLVAAYHADSATGPAPWPETEDDRDRRDGTDLAPAGSEPAGRRPEDAGDRPSATDRTNGTDRTDRAAATSFRPPDGDGHLLDGLDGFGATLPADDEEEDYQPPAPPPLPHLAGITVLAVVGIVVGLLLIIDPDLLPVDVGLSYMLGGASLVGGAIALIARMRSGDDDDPDDPHAVV